MNTIRNLGIIELDFFHSLVVPFANFNKVTLMTSNIPFQRSDMFVEPCPISSVQMISDSNGHIGYR